MYYVDCSVLYSPETQGSYPGRNLPCHEEHVNKNMKPENCFTFITKASFGGGGRTYALLLFFVIPFIFMEGCVGLTNLTSVLIHISFIPLLRICKIYNPLLHFPRKYIVNSVNLSECIGPISVVVAFPPVCLDTYIR